GQLMLADDFVMTPEKRAHIDKANAQLKSGDHDKAIDELKLAAIDVNYTRVWMPMEQSEKHLDKAIKLAKSGKYYEANLALKAIQDNLTVDSVSLDELPKT
ncbi:MAG TPA: YfdX family protein, partial [Dokdonella sp.]|uniref:YfdX family protein n=1 Tax=Dokdonella sp. TaxID=2291710 RepID=UPI002D7FCC03